MNETKKCRDRREKAYTIITGQRPSSSRNSKPVEESLTNEASSEEHATLAKLISFYLFICLFIYLFNILIDYAITVVPFPPFTPLHPAHPLLPTFLPRVHVHGSYL